MASPLATTRTSSLASSLRIRRCGVALSAWQWHATDPFWSARTATVQFGESPIGGEADEHLSTSQPGKTLWRLSHCHGTVGASPRQVHDWPRISAAGPVDWIT